MAVIDENADADQGAKTKVGQGAADETELIAPAEGARMWSEDGAAWSD
jgi:hypothetical protein